MVRLSGDQRILLQALQDLGKDLNTGFVTDSVLADTTGIALPQVRDLLQTLEDTAFVDVARTEEGLKAAIWADGRIYLRKCVESQLTPFLLQQDHLLGVKMQMSKIEDPSNPTQRPVTGVVSDRIMLKPSLSPEPDANIKLKLYIEIFNLTPSDIVVSAASFTAHDAKALWYDPLMTKNVKGARYFCEFRNDRRDAHTEYRSFLRPKQSTTTFVGLDPGLRNDAVLDLLKTQNLGVPPK